MTSATKTSAYQIAVTETTAMADLKRSELCFLQSFMPPKTAYGMPTARDAGEGNSLRFFQADDSSFAPNQGLKFVSSRLLYGGLGGDGPIASCP